MQALTTPIRIGVATAEDPTRAWAGAGKGTRPLNHLLHPNNSLQRPLLHLRILHNLSRLSGILHPPYGG